MEHFDEEREAYQNWCQLYTKWKDDYLFAYDSVSHTYSNPLIELGFQLWFNAWSYGFDEGHRLGYAEGKEDNRMGITDKIKPELMDKKLRDWGII